MKVLLLGADHGGCFKYRVTEPARVARQLGVDVEVSHNLPVESTVNPLTQILNVTEVHTDADVIVFQRPLDNGMNSAILQAKRQGITTIVELDDDFLDVHPDNSAYATVFGYKHSGIDWLVKSCKDADYLISSTDYIQGRYSFGGPGSTIKNYVPESIFDITPRYERTDETRFLGWTGSVGTHPHDLQITKGAIAEAMHKHDLTFAHIGERTLEAMLYMGIPIDSPKVSPGWVSLDNYYEAMADSMDVGVVPLEKSKFNDSKSYLKGLEMGALGIPFVASDVYEYRIFEAYKIGVTASRPREWFKQLDRLVSDRNKLVSVAKDYRDRIREEYTYELHASEWVRAWEEASKIRKI